MPQRSPASARVEPDAASQSDRPQATDGRPSIASLGCSPDRTGCRLQGAAIRVHPGGADTYRVADHAGTTACVGSSLGCCASLRLPRGDRGRFAWLAVVLPTALAGIVRHSDLLNLPARAADSVQSALANHLETLLRSLLRCRHLLVTVVLTDRSFSAPAGFLVDFCAAQPRRPLRVARCGDARSEVTAPLPSAAGRRVRIEQAQSMSP